MTWEKLVDAAVWLMAVAQRWASMQGQYPAEFDAQVALAKERATAMIDDARAAELAEIKRS